MSAFAVATLYFGLFGFLMLALKMNVGRVRAKEKVMFGDGANEAMQRAIRVQGNAVEDVPIVLIHALGGSFFVARILHAIGLGGTSGSSFGRMVGTLVTLIVKLVTAGACVWFALT